MIKLVPLAAKLLGKVVGNALNKYPRKNDKPLLVSSAAMMKWM